MNVILFSKVFYKIQLEILNQVGYNVFFMSRGESCRYALHLLQSIGIDIDFHPNS